MDLAAAGLQEQPFPSHGKPLAIANYASQQHALSVLQATHEMPHGLCLFQGPPLSGKSTVIRQYVDTLAEDVAVAVVDGKGLNTTGLLEAVLRQFGYVLDHSSITELLAMLRVFTMQQTALHEPPLLVVENAHALNPSALRALCELADLKVRQTSALKIVLVSDRSLLPIIESPSMDSIQRRLSHDFHLRPMTSRESTEYLHLKLLSAGNNTPEAVFPAGVCTALWRSSGGWPGILDRIALLTLAKTETLPATADLVASPTLPQGTWDDTGSPDSAGPPTLFVSLDGEVLQEITIEKARLLIGRSEHNDLTINSKFLSRHHAVVVHSADATFLMDLNSTNGVFVNSKRVTNHYLINDDVISIGHHRIKFVDPQATKRGVPDQEKFADTAIMKTLDDMRNMLADDDSRALPIVKTDKLPTSRF